MKNRNLINVSDEVLEKIIKLGFEFEKANLNKEIAIVEAECRIDSYCNCNDIEINIDSYKYKNALEELVDDLIERDIWEMMDDSSLDEMAEEAAIKYGLSN